MAGLRLWVNGKDVAAEIAPDMLLADFLREKLGLLGTRMACETGQCGACVVIFNGKSVKSCLMLALQADGGAITTIEGMRDEGDLSGLQALFRKHHAAQCGYCTSGMIMTAATITAKDEATIRQNLGGNICRCTGYQGILKAIEEKNA